MVCADAGIVPARTEGNSLKMNYAPIALFVYNRLWHTRQTVEALLANAESVKSPLYIFSDAPKNVADEKLASEVRHYIREVDGFSTVHIIERTENYGLVKSIIDGVTKVCQDHGRVIVLEDDIVVSIYFLKFMNEALTLYEHDERVISIGGYQYPIKATLPETFFLKGADCWGWATWKRGWDLFESDGKALLQELKQRRLTHRFDFDGTYPYTKMLKHQIRGKKNSWAIRWYASAFLKDKLTLYPGHSLVLNIGLDSTGTNCSTTSAFTGDISDVPVKVELIPVEENLFARKQIGTYFQAVQPWIMIRVIRKLKKICLDKRGDL
jgi:hypothetical protein